MIHAFSSFSPLFATLLKKKVERAKEANAEETQIIFYLKKNATKVTLHS